MATEETKDLYKLIGSYENFSSQVLDQLQEVRQSLKDGDDRMSRIEQKVAAPTFCPAHPSIIAMLEKKDQKDEEHDKAIGKLKTDVAVVKYQLSPEDKRKLNIASLSGVGSLAVWAITYVLKIVFHINL